MATWNANATQTKFMEILKENADITLAQASEIAGFEIKTGSINTLITKGLVISNKNAEKVCPCCGRKSKVSTYRLAE